MKPLPGKIRLLHDNYKRAEKALESLGYNENRLRVLDPLIDEIRWATEGLRLVSEEDVERYRAEVRLVLDDWARSLIQGLGVEGYSETREGFEKFLEDVNVAAVARREKERQVEKDATVARVSTFLNGTSWAGRLA